MEPCGGRAVAIVGATASGKSHLALTLAAEFHGEIVSCDALQIYRGMDIGTAKPTAEERAAVPHHMLDLRDPGQDFSAGEYQRLGREAMRGILRRGRLPVVAGGTGFYLRALVDGLFEGPARSEAVRARLRRIARRRGSACLHRLLHRVDPRAAARISPADGERIIRALELFMLTGTPMSTWQEKPRDALRGIRWLKIGVSWPREHLYARINARVTEMYHGGFIDEVRALSARFPAGCQAFKAIGYRECAAHLDGALELDRAISETQLRTRHYAKRQLTWLRSDPDIVWLDAAHGFAAVEAGAAALVRDFLG